MVTINAKIFHSSCILHSLSFQPPSQVPDGLVRHMSRIGSWGLLLFGQLPYGTYSFCCQFTGLEQLKKPQKDILLAKIDKLTVHFLPPIEYVPYITVIFRPEITIQDIESLSTNEITVEINYLGDSERLFTDNNALSSKVLTEPLQKKAKLVLDAVQAHKQALYPPVNSTPMYAQSPSFKASSISASTIQEQQSTVSSLQASHASTSSSRQAEVFKFTAPPPSALPSLSTQPQVYIKPDPDPIIPFTPQVIDNATTLSFTSEAIKVFLGTKTGFKTSFGRTLRNLPLGLKYKADWAIIFDKWWRLNLNPQKLKASIDDNVEAFTISATDDRTVLRGKNGARAKKYLKPGTVLGFYAGEYCTNEEFEKKPWWLKRQQYDFGVSNPKDTEGVSIDGYDKSNCLACINAASTHGHFPEAIQKPTQNVHFITVQRPVPCNYGDIGVGTPVGVVFVYTMEDIPAGKELLADYGESFWKKLKKVLSPIVIDDGDC
jgi:hypothetical protein